MNYSQKMWKRILSMVLAIIITLTMIPVSETYAATFDAVELNETEVTLEEINSTEKLDISAVYDDTAEPQEVEEYTVEWSSEDTNIATVSSDGQITAVGAGETTINVTAKYTDVDGNEKSSSGSATVKVYVTPTVKISATTDTIVKYPAEVVFDVETGLETVGEKTVSIVKEGEENLISYTIGQPITLEVGKYTVSASVGADGYHKTANAIPITYVVEQAEENGAEISSIPEEMNCEESFELSLPQQKKADGTELGGTYKIEIEELDANDASLENVNPGETITLTAGEEPTTATVMITFTPDDSNYAPITYGKKNVSVKAISLKQEEISLAEEVYWNDTIEMVLPELKTEKDDQSVEGKYSVSLTNIVAVDADGNEITDLTSMEPTTICLKANKVTEDAKVKISFTPNSTKYSSVEYSEFIINVKPIPVVATWNNPNLFEKDYDANNTLTINDAPTLSFADEYTGAVEKPTLVDRETYVFDLEDPNAGEQNATLAEQLELNEDNYKLVDANPTVTVTVNPIELDESNIEYADAQGKSFDASAAAVVNLNLKNGNDKFIEDPSAQLSISYTAEYYRAGNPESGDPEQDVEADEIIISGIKIVDSQGNCNYKPASDKIEIPGPFKIAKNAGFLDFVNSDDLRTQFGSFVEEDGIETYWFSKDETKNISSTGFKFSDELDGSWSESYTVANTTPTKIYAKNEAGLISGGIYVAMDETAPSNGQIFAKTAESDTVISVQDLTDKFEKLTGGEDIEIVFAGSDNESKISTIEWYGSDIAWDENNKAAWDMISPEDPIYVNKSSDKEKDVEQEIELITSEQDLKRFYYARITDFAGNVAYISSSGVLQDINEPEATFTLQTEKAGTYGSRGVYKADGKIEFQIDIADPEISSGISAVSVVLKDYTGRELNKYDVNTEDIWTSKDAIDNIKNLPDHPTEDEILAANAGPLTGELTLEDGFYTLSVTVTDKVGHESDVSSVDFIVDNKAPVITIAPLDEQLSYIKERTAKNLYTGGTIEVTVEELTLTTELTEMLQGTGIDGANVVWKEERDEKTGLATYITTLEFGDGKTYPEGEYSFETKAVDSLNRETKEAAKDNIEQDGSESELETFIIDYTAPKYTVKFSETNENAYTGDVGKVYYGIGKEIKATFEVTEKTTYDDSLIKIIVKNNAGKSVISWIEGEAKPEDNSGNYHLEHAAGTQTFVLTIDAVAENEDDGYTFSIEGQDRTGNSLEANGNAADEVNKVRVLDVTVPVLNEIKYEPENGGKFNTVDGRDYVNAETKMTFTMEEHHPTPSSLYKITSEGNEWLEASWSTSGDESTTNFTVPVYNEDKGCDEQTITLAIVDKAENIVVLGTDTKLRSENNTTFKDGMFTDKFTVDTVAPIIKLEYVDFKPDRPATETGDGIDYFRKKVTVKVTVDEHNFNKVLFEQMVARTDNNVDYSESEWDTSGDLHVKTFVFSKDNQYDLSIKGYDNAKNGFEKLDTSSDLTATLDTIESTAKVSVAVDTTLPEIGDTAKPVIVIKPSSAPGETTEGDALYNSDVTYKVVVYDPLLNKYASGIDNITFDVTSEDGTSAACTVDKAGNIKTGNGVSITRVGGDVKKLAQGKENKYTFNVTLSSDVFNTNEIVLSVSAEDVSTNIKEDVKADPIAIDTTAPKVVVSYDNNDVSNDKYFHADRIATIKVTERNFSDDCLQFMINGKNAELHFNLQSKGSGNRDNAVWVATYDFSVDGDYEIEVECEDRATNKGTVEYEGEAPQDFTIDKTNPVITVVYDNNNFQNEFYYKEARTATITIEEHNFSSDDVVVTMTANDDGTSIAVPGVNGWTNEGDFHRATIHYNYDAEFTFDIEYADLATNEADEYDQDHFVVDQTAPELEIFDIEHMSANNGVVRPGIRYHDTNYDQNGTVILMTGYHNGVVEMTGDRKLEANGLELKLDDFAYVQEMDDIYTMEAAVYDLAGNSSEAMVMFSVNRFGSVYTFDEATDALIGDNGKYYTNKEQQLVITETNVDTLEFKEITLNLNGKLTTLKEGEDYTVALDGNDATWKQYTYTLKADNFVEEGTYILTIYSEDRATNTSDNNTKGKKIEFVVDKTNPSALISGVENGGQYRMHSKEVTIDIEDNVRLSSVTVTIDGVETVYDAAQIHEMDGKLVLNIGSANHWQDVVVEVTDAAGNTEISEEMRVLVTANIFVQFFMNKPVFYGTLGGTALLAALLWWFLVGKKKKEQEEAK